MPRADRHPIPVLGSPVADALVTRPPLRRAIGAAARALGGEIAGVDDLTTTVRTAWMQAHQPIVAQLVPKIFCCASWVEPSGAGPYRAGARWMQRRGAGPNDGLVPVASALVPGARHLVLEGHHRALVSSGRKRDPAAVLRRLLTAALLPDILA